MTNIPVSERVNWIGASEAACVLGVSKFQTPFEIWHRKRRAALGEFEENERIQAGRHLEPAIAAWAREKWDWDIEPFGDYLTHPTVARFGASLDWQESASLAPVEIKNVDYLIFRDDWEAEGDTIIDAPLYYIIQVQSQLAMRPGVEYGWLLACVAGNKLYRMKIDRHAKSIEKIEGAVAEFWASVDAGIEPSPNYNQDAATLSFLYDTAALGAVVDLRGSNHAASLCHDYKAAAAREKGAKEAKSAAKAELVNLIRQASNIDPGEDPAKGRVLLDGFSVSLSRVAASEIDAYTREPYTTMRINTLKAKES